MKITVIKKSNGKVKTMSAVPLDHGRAAGRQELVRHISLNRLLDGVST